MDIESIPNGWAIRSFMEVFDINGGTQPPKNTFSYNPEYGLIRLLQIRDFGDKPFPTYITPNKNLRLCKKDDVLIARYGASIGRICTGQEGAYNVALAKVLIPKDIEKRFVFYLLKSNFFQDPILKIERSAQDGFNKEDLSEVFLPLPPLNEQRRIVAKLEVLLGKVDACQKRLEKIPRILKRFRQSVLAAACDGRLTVDWREKNNFNIQDWLSTSLSKVANLRLGKMLDKVKNIGEPTLYLRNINVRWFSFELDNLALIKCTDKDRKDLSICDGDVLICEGGEPGRCAVWSHGKMNLIFQKAIHRVRLVDNVLPYWLMINIKTDADSGHLESYFTGTTIKHLTGQSLAKYSFDVPPLAEQQEIVRRVESLFKLTDQLEARYQKAKSYVDKLTQSILAKAFRGELVAQDPNDEPASMLLERIKQEKEAATTEKPRKVNVKSKVANKKESKEPKDSKEIVIENSISNKEKFIEVMEEKINSSLDKIAADVEKLGEQMTLPFMENEK